MSNKQVVGGFQAPRKKSVQTVRNYDDKSLIIYESLQKLSEPSEPFMANNIRAFLEQAELGVTANLEQEDGTDVTVSYPVSTMSDLEPDMVRKNCPVIKEQHTKRTALKNIMAMLPKYKKEETIWSLPMEERKARANAFRQFSKNYSQLAE